jgi:hypothetical protein
MSFFDMVQDKMWSATENPSFEDIKYGSISDTQFIEWLKEKKREFLESKGKKDFTSEY